ncbi:MAG: helix-turn-helix domain-containing protein [Clostridiales bacterium]|nr:helix-turn-helix domain-containing protein [Clostridiales bacterium]
MKKESVEQVLPYQAIDMRATGQRLKEYADRAGLSVRQIQCCLQLAYPQPIYRWYRGDILPSINHLYMLSVLMHVHMEELLVVRDENN